MFTYREQQQQTTAPEISIPIGEYKVGSYSFFEALLDITEINDSSKAIIAFAYWNMSKPYPKHHAPLEFGIVDRQDPTALLAKAIAKPPKAHNQELIVFEDYSAKLIINAHVTLEFKPNTFLISPAEHWRFQ